MSSLLTSHELHLFRGLLHEGGLLAQENAAHQGGKEQVPVGHLQVLGEVVLEEGRLDPPDRTLTAGVVGTGVGNVGLNLDTFRGGRRDNF